MSERLEGRKPPRIERHHKYRTEGKLILQDDVGVYQVHVNRGTTGERKRARTAGSDEARGRAHAVTKVVMPWRLSLPEKKKTDSGGQGRWRGGVERRALTDAQADLGGGPCDVELLDVLGLAGRVQGEDGDGRRVGLQHIHEARTERQRSA